jgi:hypothetical protein
MHGDPRSWAFFYNSDPTGQTLSAARTARFIARAVDDPCAAGVVRRRDPTPASLPGFNRESLALLNPPSCRVWLGNR